jgi:hypothetical protein
MRYSGPQLLSSWLHGASAEATKLPAPSQARVVGPAELTVRRRFSRRAQNRGVRLRDRGSVRTGDDPAMTTFGTMSCPSDDGLARTDRAKLESSNRT